MDHFEYKCIAVLGGGEKTARVLDKYGQDGWELVTVVLFWHYLKRRLPESE